MISYVERGMRNPTLEIMLRLAEAVGVKLEILIKRARATIE
jgi:transcriptional regulator with XRE-family HTH domain